MLAGERTECDVVAELLEATLEALAIADYTVYGRDVAVAGQGGSTLPPLVVGANTVVQEQHQK